MNRLFSPYPRPVHACLLRRSALKLAAVAAAVLLGSTNYPVHAVIKETDSVEAFLYSTMPSTFSHSPEMAMDRDPKTYFKSVYGMGDGDDVHIVLSRAIPVQSLRITTGDDEGQELLTDGFVDISADGVGFKKAASFNAAGVAEAALSGKPVLALRIRLNRNKGISSLIVREITIKSPIALSHVQRGPGRGFTDLSQAPDLAVWAEKAEKQMEAFWPDTDALLYSDKFITPNKVNVVYKTGPGVTPVAATGGGVLTVNSKWCREHPEDTGLMVHEMAHVVQSMSAYNPVWLIEGIADYIRWVKFEPENHKPRIDVKTASYKDSYRTTATFLGWCELKYDSSLVTKLNRATRFGTYSDDLFVKYCGKEVAALWAEFVADYQKDPAALLTPAVAPADRPRSLPAVVPGSSIPVDLTSFYDTIGIYNDGVSFSGTGGFDAGGAAYSGALLRGKLAVKDVTFALGKANILNAVSARGNTVALPSGSYKSLWLLGAAIEGSQRNQKITVTYSDGTQDDFYQNFSDWFQPQRFPGESRAARTPYRNMADGSKDPRAFYGYSYGFALNPSKTVKSVTLPKNEFVKVLGVTLAK